MATEVKPDLMVEAGKELLHRSEQIAEVWADVVEDFVWKCHFGGQGGDYSDYPRSYSTGGITISGFWWWEDDTTVIESETYTYGTNAPWAEEMYTKWTEEVRNRTWETIAIAEELGELKRMIIQALVDLTDVDVQNAGLIQAQDRWDR